LSAATNFDEFTLVKEDLQWGHFFRDFEALEVGEKINIGTQAKIYGDCNTPNSVFYLEVKVMKVIPSTMAHWNVVFQE